MILAGWGDSRYTTPYILSVVTIARNGRKRVVCAITRGNYFSSEEVRDTLSNGTALELILKEKEPAN